MTTTKQILLNAHNVLQTNDWCTFSPARDSQGRPVSYNASTACSYCLVGAVFKAAQPFGHDADNEMHAALIKLRGLVASEATFLGAWNDADGRTKDEVLNLLELAAQSC